ncbi:MAG: F0F1 ATP synthase subunit epsilon [Clostridia bacterium]|nr:F0F1 ATP synthase subunit epsilon [Clostridia bacterium]
MKTFLLSISSPDGNLFSGEVVMITLRGIEGDLAVMAGHIPFITSVVPCDVKITLPDGTDKVGHADGGLLTVAEDGVTLLGSFAW